MAKCSGEGLALAKSMCGESSVLQRVEDTYFDNETGQSARKTQGIILSGLGVGMDGPMQEFSAGSREPEEGGSGVGRGV